MLEAKSKFIPFPFYWNNVPIDLSFIYECEKPAGKHGFLKVEGNRFMFEDGTEGRFWGTNFNSGLNFPPFDFSEKIARRLSKIGVNIVRFHQMDAEWATPNIFQFAKGKRKGNTLDFDPESMKRLDYLIYCLKKEGIYVYLDLLTYRKFKSGDGVENALQLSDAARPYSNYSRKFIELQKKYNYDLWTHVNTYTGLAYKDDPVIVLTEIANESDMFHKGRTFVIEPYRSELVNIYRLWLTKRKIDVPESEIDFSKNDEFMLEFLRNTQEDYYIEMIEYLREIGVIIPITGTNWSINAANRRAQLVTDFSDGHTYWYGWKWEEKLKKLDNRPLVAEINTVFPNLSFCRILDKPFFVSEWDEPWPNEWRAESTLLMAAAGLLQGWSGYAIHTYSYSTMTDINITGKEVTSKAIGGVPYREGVFNTWNDPAKFGLFYHAALMYRRGDVKPAEKSIAIEVKDMSLNQGIPALSLISERHKVGLQFDGQVNIADETIASDKELIDKNNGEILSDTGELYRSWKKKIGWIDTENTKAAYGFLGEVGIIELNGMKLTVGTQFATIAVSTLTDQPISKSDNLLLTTVGRSENTGMKFNESHTEMLDIGQAPILVEVIEAEISIKTEIPNLRVWAVNAEGFFTGAVPSEYNNGMLKFKVGECFCSMYYLVQAE